MRAGQGLPTTVPEMGLFRHLGILPVLLGLFAISCSQTTLSDDGEGTSTVCYWQSWSQKRPAPYTYDIDDIPVHLCTHVIYSYAKLDSRSSSLYLDEDFDSRKDGYFRFLELKKRNPRVKLLLALGDRNGSDSAEWHQTIRQPTRRFHVVSMLHKLLDQYRFDGVHLNWEIPMKSPLAATAPRTTNDQLIKLVSHIRRTFKWSDFMVSCVIALPRLEENLSAGVRGLLPYVDLFHASVWTASDVKINSTAPAISRTPSAGQSGPLSDANISKRLHQLTELGLPPEKIILEIPFFGWKALSPQSSEQHLHGPNKADHQIVPYYEVSSLIRSGVPSFWDKSRRSYYLLLDQSYRVYYDDANSARRKVLLARSLGMAGVAAWGVDMDNMDATFMRKNDLLKGIVEGMKATLNNPTTAGVEPTEHSSQNESYYSNSGIFPGGGHSSTLPPTDKVTSGEYIFSSISQIGVHSQTSAPSTKIMVSEERTMSTEDSTKPVLEFSSTSEDSVSRATHIEQGEQGTSLPSSGGLTTSASPVAAIENIETESTVREPVTSTGDDQVTTASSSNTQNGISVSTEAETTLTESQQNRTLANNLATITTGGVGDSSTAASAPNTTEDNFPEPTNVTGNIALVSMTSQTVPSTDTSPSAAYNTQYEYFKTENTTGAIDVTTVMTDGITDTATAESATNSTDYDFAQTTMATADIDLTNVSAEVVSFTKAALPVSTSNEYERFETTTASGIIDVATVATAEVIGTLTTVPAPNSTSYDFGENTAVTDDTVLTNVTAGDVSFTNAPSSPSYSTEREHWDATTETHPVDLSTVTTEEVVSTPTTVSAPNSTEYDFGENSTVMDDIALTNVTTENVSFTNAPSSPSYSTEREHWDATTETHPVDLATVTTEEIIGTPTTVSAPNSTEYDFGENTTATDDIALTNVTAGDVSFTHAPSSHSYSTEREHWDATTEKHPIYFGTVTTEEIIGTPTTVYAPNSTEYDFVENTTVTDDIVLTNVTAGDVSFTNAPSSPSYSIERGHWDATTEIHPIDLSAVTTEEIIGTSTTVTAPNSIEYDFGENATVKDDFSLIKVTTENVSFTNAPWSPSYSTELQLWDTTTETDPINLSTITIEKKIGASATVYAPNSTEYDFVENTTVTDDIALSNVTAGDVSFTIAPSTPSYSTERELWDTTTEADPIDLSTVTTEKIIGTPTTVSEPNSTEHDFGESTPVKDDIALSNVTAGDVSSSKAPSTPSYGTEREHWDLTTETDRIDLTTVTTAEMSTPTTVSAANGTEYDIGENTTVTDDIGLTHITTDALQSTDDPASVSYSTENEPWEGTIATGMLDMATVTTERIPGTLTRLPAPNSTLYDFAENATVTGDIASANVTAEVVPSTHAPESSSYSTEHERFETSTATGTIELTNASSAGLLAPVTSAPTPYSIEYPFPENATTTEGIPLGKGTAEWMPATSVPLSSPAPRNVWNQYTTSLVSGVQEDTITENKSFVSAAVGSASTTEIPSDVETLASSPARNSFSTTVYESTDGVSTAVGGVKRFTPSEPNLYQPSSPEDHLRVDRATGASILGSNYETTQKEEKTTEYTPRDSSTSADMWQREESTTEAFSSASPGAVAHVTTPEEFATTPSSEREISTKSAALDKVPSLDRAAPEKQCEGMSQRTLPHESDREFYYRCYRGMALLRKCASGLRFNSTSGRCGPEHIALPERTVTNAPSLSLDVLKLLNKVASGELRLGQEDKIGVNVDLKFNVGE